MAITQEEYLAKRQIMERLAKQGYPTYARLLDLFDLHLTNDPDVVGYMIPDKGVIVLNRNLDIDQVSTIVRHEILHEYLSHQIRMKNHLGADVYDNRDPSIHQLINIAGDYEISNRGYTDADKKIARAIKLNGQVLKGLVTEDDHPDWVDLPIEEMFDRLYKQYQEDKKALQPLIDMISKLMKQGDPDIQKAEEIEREAKDISDKLQGKGKGSSVSDPDFPSLDNQDSDGEGTQDKSGEETKDQKGAGGDAADLAKKADDISKKAGKLAKDMKADSDNNSSDKDSSSTSNDGEVFDTPKEQADNIKIAKRLKEIEKAFDDVKNKASLERETDIIKNKDKAKAAERELKKYKADPTVAFADSLNDFIRREIGFNREDSWTRPNRRYQGTGIIAKGKASRPKRQPVINVYFDQSGSWTEDHIKLGNRLIGVLKNYQDKGKLKLNLKYFSNKVHNLAREARAEGGTAGQPVLQDILDTNPDNVIVMTDDDITDCSSDVTVPGTVWFLWKDGLKSNNLRDHLHGKRQTKEFDIKDTTKGGY